MIARPLFGGLKLWDENAKVVCQKGNSPEQVL
jgi:hypothetical protein